MRIIRSFFIALSMYSKIPVPHFAWNEEDMRYALCFFPWVGAAIGAVELFWFWLCSKYAVGVLAFACVGAALPLVISGGIHVDGYMDTIDALCSYQDRESKLAILKDSHIGAFSVIGLALYYLIYLGAFSEIRTGRQMTVLALSFILSRVLSGIAVIEFRCAKKEGTLYTFAGSAHKWAVRMALTLQLVLCVGAMLFRWLFGGAVVAVGMFAVFVYYRYKAYREFGGITGDVAGYFVTLAEGGAVFLVACLGYV